MNLEITDEQRALRDTVRQFLAEHAGIASHLRAVIDDPTGTTPEVWRDLAELGAAGVLVPDGYGGAGLTMTDAAIVSEEMGAAAYSGPWLSSAVAAPRAIARFAAESSAADLLSSLSEGTRIATVGPLDSSATLVGTDRLRGEFSVRDAAAADVILTPVEVDGEAALYLVETESAHVTVAREPGIDQTRRSFHVTYDDAPAQLLASAPAQAVSSVVDDVLIAEAADALGAAARLVDMVVDHAKTRVQFGQPIGSFQSVAHLCVDMFESVELARSGVIHAAWAADESDMGEHHAAALRIKAFSGRLAAVGDTAIQVFGGIGYTWEHDAHFYLKRLLSWSSLMGSSDRYLEDVGSMFARSVIGSSK